MSICQQKVSYEDIYIREVRIQYYPTDKPVFAITGPKSVKDFVLSVLPDNSREHTVALYLNGAHEVICYSLISTGTANAAMVSPREIFQRALSVGAVSLVLSHNHPSGQVTPSQEDCQVTTKIKEAGQLLNIKLLDHVIISDSDCYSFQDKGEL
ncbi:MAG: hypothetical protein EOP06_20655 [Proteobacteria bacterium]|nr:MAG: hypothetical protein EOP06_20655 [Pseudomonadota bacterium]